LSQYLAEQEAKLQAALKELPRDRDPRRPLTATDVLPMARALGLPRYWLCLFTMCAAAWESRGPISVERLSAVWRTMQSTCFDDASRFFFLTTGGRHRPGITRDDLFPLLSDVVKHHPGLDFLASKPEFQSRYMETVIERTFYAINASWSGVISEAELRRSSFVSAVLALEHSDDINTETQFFSYEHFYVIYCKFWELDTDHDLVIGVDELLRYGDNGLSSRAVDRILQGCVTRCAHTSSHHIAHSRSHCHTP
jgi:serine/threonine-protein phosphatase 2A regulatory subunit B''